MYVCVITLYGYIRTCNTMRVLLLARYIRFLFFCLFIIVVVHKRGMYYESNQSTVSQTVLDY